MTLGCLIKHAAGRILPVVPALTLRRARVAFRARDLAAAARHYEIFLRLRPHDMGSWIQFGHVLKESRQAEAAEQAYREATRVAPHCVSGHRQLGRFLERLGRREQACRTFLRGLAVAPDAIDLQDALVTHGQKLQELDGPLLLAALEVGEPNDVERRHGRMIWNRARAGFHAWLAHRAERRAHWSEARRHLLRSLSADPSRPSVHIRLGDALTAIGAPSSGRRTMPRPILHWAEASLLWAMSGARRRPLRRRYAWRQAARQRVRAFRRRGGRPTRWTTWWPPPGPSRSQWASFVDR